MSEEQKKCAGCGRDVSTASHGTVGYDPKARLALEFEIVPGVRRAICRNARYTGSVVSDACLEQARKKANLCPACGESEVRALGVVCRDCLVRVKMQRALEAQQTQPVRYYEIDLARLAQDLTYYAGDRELAQQASEALVAVLTTRSGAPASMAREVVTLPSRDRGHASGVGSRSQVLELTQSQADALQPLLESFRKLLQVQHKRGVERGRSALMALSSGEITVAEFTKRALEGK